MTELQLWQNFKLFQLEAVSTEFQILSDLKFCHDIYIHGSVLCFPTMCRLCQIMFSFTFILSRYMGWFSGDIEELTGYQPSEEAARLVRLGGGVEDVVEKAQVALSQRDYQWALELATSVLHVDEKNRPAARIRRQALKGH